MRRSVGRSRIVLLLTAALIGCASEPPTLAPTPPPVVTYEQKVASILKLEDERRLREPTAIVAPVAPPPPTTSRGRPVVVPPSVPPPPDLLRLLGDGEARVRRRAALAIGRVGLREGVAPLVARLSDPEPEVRQMVAFALGLLGDPSARDPLLAKLEDEQPVVGGSAAEALGLIGDPSAADAIGRMAARLVGSGALTPLPGDEADTARDTPAAAVRLALFALVRLKAFAPLAAAVLDGNGQPRVRWWPVAFALQRLEDPRGAVALLTLVRDSHPYTRALAVRGLGAMKEVGGVVPALVPLITGSDRHVAVEAIRALGRLGDARATGPLLAVARARKADPHVRVEAVGASGGLSGEQVTEMLLDTVTDASPAVRSAALRALAQRDPESFLTVLSGLDADPEWSVRAALAGALGTLSPAAGLPRLRAMLSDGDGRVVSAVLGSLVRLKVPEAVTTALTLLQAEDPASRIASARALGELQAKAHGPALVEAYRRGRGDSSYVARAAALVALVDSGAPEAVATLTEALADTDWAVRLRAAAMLRSNGAVPDALERIRPAPPSREGLDYAASHLVAPSISTQCFIDTDRGTIQVELAVLDAPLTADNFVTLARKGFFDGLTFHRVVPGFVAQAGDPRGDSDGGPGYTIRDEINQRPHVRGVIGMAIDWADTGGSQFFITYAPQPQLDARSTVFGRVLTGMDVVDRLEPGAVIHRVRVWDGTP